LAFSELNEASASLPECYAKGARISWGLLKKSCPLFRKNGQLSTAHWLLVAKYCTGGIQSGSKCSGNRGMWGQTASTDDFFLCRTGEACHSPGAKWGI